MSATIEKFDYSYELTASYNSSGTLTFTLGQLAAGNITVKDPDGGDVTGGETLKVSKIGFNGYENNSPFDTGKYTFIETATIGHGAHAMDGIVVLDQATNQFFFLTDNAYSSRVGTTSVVNGDPDTTICFMAGTLIRTANGEVAVEQLKRGDLVITQDGRSVPVDWLGVQTVSLRFADKARVLPIRIRAGALAENVPSRDLLVSPDHAILVDGALIHAGALVNGTSIVRETNVPMTFTYYHVEVEDHSLILAENAPAETFVDNVDRLNFDNWAEHEALYPNGKHVDELPYPRAKSHRQVPVRTRIMLADRAQAIGVESFSAVAV